MARNGMGRGGGQAGGFGKNSTPGLSFNVELLGHGLGEFHQPPPTYPPLINKPLPLECTDTDEYLLALNRDFLDYLKESPAFFQPVIVKNDIERYSDRYQTTAQSLKRLSNAPFDWSRFPEELHPRKKKKRKITNIVVSKKKAKIDLKNDDINIKLEELEKIEDEDKDKDEENEEGEGDEEGEQDDLDLDMQDEDIDDEMDLGTDYINNYFDNGENYLDDEDDNLDDGAVY